MDGSGTTLSLPVGRVDGIGIWEGEPCVRPPCNSPSGAGPFTPPKLGTRVQPSHNQKQQTKLATAQAQNDQRETKESPVVVDVLSHPKSQEEAAQGKRAADRKKIPIAKRISQVPTDAKHNNFIGKVSPSKQLRPISDHGSSPYQRHFFGLQHSYHRSR
jgi:hypothetical protein